jgi:hypothetical protein
MTNKKASEVAAQVAEKIEPELANFRAGGKPLVQAAAQGAESKIPEWLGDNKYKLLTALALGSGGLYGGKQVYDTSKLYPFQHPMMVRLLPRSLSHAIMAMQTHKKWGSTMRRKVEDLMDTASKHKLLTGLLLGGGALGAGVAADKLYSMSQLMPFKHPILTSLLPGPVDKSIIAYQNRNKWAAYVGEMQKYAMGVPLGRIAPMMEESAANVAHAAGSASAGMLSRGVSRGMSRGMGRIGDMIDRGSLRVPKENQLRYDIRKFNEPGQTHVPMANADAPQNHQTQTFQGMSTADMSQPQNFQGMRPWDMSQPQNYQPQNIRGIGKENISPLQNESQQYESQQYDNSIGPNPQSSLFNRGADRLGRAAMPMASRFPRIAGFLNGDTGGVMTNRSLGRGIMRRGLPMAAGAAFLGNAPFVGVNNAKANWQREHPIQSLLARTFGGMPAYQQRSYFAPSFLQG